MSLAKKEKLEELREETGYSGEYWIYSKISGKNVMKLGSQNYQFSLNDV